MVTNKKGLSDIITNVLIILLVLVAITIIWFFIKPTIERGAGQLPGAGDCLTIQLEPVSCTVDAGAGEYTAVVRRSSGEGQLQGVSLQFTASDNQAIAVSENQVVGIGESASLGGTDARLIDLTAPVTLKVAAVVKTSEGAAGRVCDVSSVAVTCT